jgi:hypothetical protein
LDHDETRGFELDESGQILMGLCTQCQIGLTQTAAAWVMNPNRLKRSSPREARATPVEIMSTMTANFLFGS